jgi:beta-lactamase regulating signal transducer with metallopeptidase domain/biopolymer transport protein ExbD
VTPDTAGQGLTATGALFGIWALVVLAGLVYAVAGSIRLATRLHGAGTVNSEDIPVIQGIEDIHVLRSGRIAMPITVAFLPGRIYVPDAWDEWTMSCRRMVLMHEMAHMKRHDGTILIMQIIARAIYFFHPFVAVLDRRLSEFREMACDDATVGRDRDSGVEYSRYLVEIAESVVRCPAVCGSASALIRRKNELLRRVSYQLEEGRMRSISRTRVMMLTAAIVLLAVSLSWYRGEASAGDDPKPPPNPPTQPGAPAVPAPPMQESSSEDRHVNILLRSNGAEIDGKKVSMEELAEALRIFAGKDPEDVIVHVFTTHDAKMGEVLFVQQTMRKMGIRRISYRTFDGKDLPLELPPQKALERFDEMPDAMKIDIVISESSLTVGSREVKFYDLEGVIREKLEETPMAVVVVYFERDANYQDFTGVMAILMAARADRVAVTFVEGE